MVIIKEILLHFFGPIAEYIFTVLGLTLFLIVYRHLWMDMTPKTKEQQRIRVTKFTFFIIAVVGVCALVVMVYRLAGVL